MTDLSPAQQLAMLANDSEDGPPQRPAMKNMSIRLPFLLVAQIDALSSVTGIQSRNALMISLLQAGVHAVVQELDDTDLYEVALEHCFNAYEQQQE
jgi:hypothetical protein